MKRLLTLTALALAGLTVAAYSLPRLISSEVVKHRVAEQLSDLTGAEVAFDGDPQLSFFPSLAFTIDNVRVGPEDRPVARMNAVRGTLRVVPLLLGRVEVTAYALERPRLVIDAEDHGLAGLAALPRSGEVKGAFGDLTVRDGTVLYSDRRRGETLIFEQVDLSVHWPSPTDAAVANGSFIWRGEKVEANATIGAPAELFAARGSPLRLAVASTPLRLTFTGSMHRLGDLQLEGDAAVTSPSLRRLIEWSGQPMEAGPTLGTAQLRGRLNWVAATIGLADATLELDGNRAVGVISATLAGDRPAIKGTLAFETLDLSPYLETFRANVATAGGWTRAPIHAAALDAADVDLRISAGQVLMGNGKLGDVAASALISQGEMSVGLGQATLYGGRLTAAVTAAHRHGRLEARAEANAQGVNVRAMLAAFADIGGLDGTGSGTFQVSGAGDRWGEFMRTLAGTAAARLDGASLSGLDLKRLVEALREPERQGLKPTDGLTRLKSVEATLAVAAGYVRTRTLTAEGDGYMLDLDGYASLFRPVISARGTLTVEPGATGLEKPVRNLPFLVGGSWRQPTISPDLDRILRRSGQAERPAVADGDSGLMLMPMLR